MHRTSRALAASLTVLLGASLCSCGGKHAARPALNPPPLAAFHQLGLDLPAPAELAGAFDAPRRPAYVETDLIKHGMDYDGGLPSRNVAKVDNSAEFSPSWSPPGGLDPANLAFCTYAFSAAGYDRAPAVYYGWVAPPTDLATAWLGLADWDDDSWDWYRCNANGKQVVPSFEPYINDADALLAIMLRANDEMSQLRWIRLGPQQLSAQLTVEPASGLSPLSAHLDATGSMCPAGSLSEVAWDFDGDGSTDESSSSNLETDHVYSEAGSWQPQVTITSEYGLQASATATVKTVGQPWVHTWFLEKYGELYDVAVDGAGTVYAVGQQNRAGQTWDDVLLLSYDSAGNLLWARLWGVEDDDAGEGLLVTDTGDVYLTGWTEYVGAGGKDVLVQRWDDAGNLVWSRTWGTAGTDQAAAIAMRNDVLYVAGNTTGPADEDADVLLLAFDTEGNLIWERTIAAANDEGALDVITTSFLSVGIHLTGYYGPITSLETLYARFNEAGELVRCTSWSSSDGSGGYALVAHRDLFTTHVYISGFAVDEVFGFGDCMLLEVGTGAMTARLWGQNEEEIACDLLLSGDEFILAGYSKDFMDDGHCRGVLLRCTLEGVLESAGLYAPDQPVPLASFFALAPYTESGIAIAGYDELATGQWDTDNPYWQDYDREGTWLDRLPAVSVETPAGSIFEPSLEPDAITAGIEDSTDDTYRKALLIVSPIL